jgi:hypothetical protein
VIASLRARLIGNEAKAPEEPELMGNSVCPGGRVRIEVALLMREVPREQVPHTRINVVRRLRAALEQSIEPAIVGDIERWRPEKQGVRSGASAWAPHGHRSSHKMAAC